VAALGATAITGCTGGDMGSTRGGGAAPGQSGGRDTSSARATAPAPGAATSATAGTSTDTTKKRTRAKQP